MARNRSVAIFDGAQWKVLPDPAYVDVDSPITWVFRNDKPLHSKLVWTVYFEQGTPFGLDQTEFCVETKKRTKGVVGPLHTKETGDFKYGVRVDDPVAKTTLGDDDPRLIVRPTNRSR